MAYPEPIPEITQSKSKEFRERLEAFELSDSQRRYYRKAFAAFERAEKEDSKD